MSFLKMDGIFKDMDETLEISIGPNISVITKRKRHKNVGIGRRETRKLTCGKLVWNSDEQGTYVKAKNSD